MRKTQPPKERSRTDRNAVQFHFSDFTTTNYRKLLQKAKSQYQFGFFNDLRPQETSLLWRHDCDASIHAAKNLATIEHEENIQSTFFILLNNEFYSLLEREIRNLVLEILAMGHRIGIHFDCAYYGIQTEAELEKWLKFEKTIFETLFNCRVDCFSFHIPTSSTQTFNKQEYAEMTNVYCSEISSTYHYCSDSNGYWRHERLADILDKEIYPRLHILTHPEHWQSDILSPRERIVRCIEGRAKKTLSQFENLLADCGRPFIDWSTKDKDV